MNMIQNSMKDIQASEELKKKTLQYLEHQRRSRTCSGARYVVKYLAAAACVFLLLGMGGYAAYARPVSYISIDINPSIELGINRFDRVVSVNAYNEDGRESLAQVSLKNISYLQAIHRLLEDESCQRFLTENVLLAITVISEQSDIMTREIQADTLLQTYAPLTYTSDLECREEAHRHDMSFGKYSAYLELAQYDGSVTVEDCHEMTMREIHNRIESCQSYDGMGGGNGEETNGQGSHHEEPDAGGVHHEEPDADGDHHEEPGVKGSDYEEPGIKGIDNEDTGIKGSDNEDPGTKGSDNEDLGIKGSDNEDLGIKGSDNEDPGTKGSDNEAPGIKGSEYQEPGVEGNHHEEPGAAHGEHHR